MSEDRQPTSQIEEFAQAQGLRVEERSTIAVIAKGLLSFFRTKPLGAAGLMLVIIWSIIAVGTVGPGGGWMGIGRYDSQDVFKVANANFADDKIANVLDGQSEDISQSELRKLLLAPEVYGTLAEESGVLDEMLAYVEEMISNGTVLTHLAELDPAQIEIDEDGTIRDVDDLLASCTPGLDTSIVLVTRNVDTDVAALPALLRTDAGYVGVMGSQRRWTTTRARLETQGVPKQTLERVHAPIGIEVGAETPEEIALSIMAEVVAQRHR